MCALICILNNVIHLFGNNLLQIKNCNFDFLVSLQCFSQRFIYLLIINMLFYLCDLKMRAASNLFLFIRKKIILICTSAESTVFNSKGIGTFILNRAFFLLKHAPHL